MRDAVDHHAARAADPFSAVVIERDGLFPCEDESFIEGVEHLEERHVRADVRDLVADEPSGGVLVRLAPHVEGYASLVATRRWVDFLEFEGLLVQIGRSSLAGELPGRYVGEVGVVALPFAVCRLVLDTEVCAAALATRERVEAHEFRQFEEVGYPPSLLQRLVQLGSLAETRTLRQNSSRIRGIASESALSDRLGARHPAVVPKNLAEFSVNAVDRTFAVDTEKPLSDRSSTARSDSLNAGSSTGTADVPRRGCEVTADGVGQHEISVGESLHERSRAEPVRALVGEVRFSEHEQARQVAHQVVVDPEPTHRVVDRRIDPHRHDGRVLRR